MSILARTVEIGDLSADSWYCIGHNSAGGPLEMSPPTLMMWRDLYLAMEEMKKDRSKRLPNPEELKQMFKVMAENSKVRVAIAEGRMQAVGLKGATVPGHVWGYDPHASGYSPVFQTCAGGGRQSWHQHSIAEVRYIR
jgi:hypothetical protein